MPEGDRFLEGARHPMTQLLKELFSSGSSDSGVYVDLPLAEPVQNSEDQTRDEHGRWTVSGATEATKAMYEKTGTASVTHEDVATHVASLQHLSHEDVKQVAAGIGVQPHRLKTKKMALDRIGAMMTARLGHAERGAEIAAVAKGGKP
jgi:hypothetical protein